MASPTASSNSAPLDADATRLSVPLEPPAAPLAVVGRQWCFDEPVTLRTSHSEWLRSFTIKNEATRATLAQIKHSLSATMYVNPDIEPFATYHVFDSKDKSHALTVQRESSSSTYEVHNGKLRHEEGPQPPLFAVTVTTRKTNGGKNATTTSEPTLFRDASTGEAYEATVEGDCRADRVALLRVRKADGGAWAVVARIHRPKPKFYQSEHYSLEIAAGVDAMFVLMAWLARWGEFQREKPQLKSYVIWESAPFDLTKQEHVERKKPETWSSQHATTGA